MTLTKAEASNLLLFLMPQYIDAEQFALVRQVVQKLIIFLEE